MARIKRAIMTHKRRKKVLKFAKGYYGAKSKQFRTAKEAVMKSGQISCCAAQRIQNGIEGVVNQLQFAQINRSICKAFIEHVEFCTTDR